MNGRGHASTESWRVRTRQKGIASLSLAFTAVPLTTNANASVNDSEDRKNFKDHFAVSRDKSKLARLKDIRGILV
jgi:hypothetical protein